MSFTLLCCYYLDRAVSCLSIASLVCPTNPISNSSHTPRVQATLSPHEKVTCVVVVGLEFDIGFRRPNVPPRRMAGPFGGVLEMKDCRI